ncbi:M23 family metallopeptidase [Aureibacter tunicatorum]|uniref:Murein DD-endopeptidase MepM/ murein hydrolase activator NlpD n=1 Tax=Aureibacter tunicatorum TaxID=866807 RepID=A0AAE3XMY2_9BACT|nr:M23 family metallopeptidase [Aureibacter tunicatorum]MDR6240876.1 murein DD-endopeptidase MepM/ murein hydrolase activator NlpD [Aureibacter tunicatorum]
MAKIKYSYDTETCKYERVKTSKSDILINALSFFSVSLIISFFILLAFQAFFTSPKEAALIKENKELKLYNEMLSKRMDDTENVLELLQSKDDNLYRTVFEAEPIPNSIRNGGVGGVKRYKDLLDLNLSQEEMIINQFEKIDRLRTRMYIQMESFDQISEMAKNKEKMWASIPAIQPVNNKEMKRLSSGFGTRMHPILKRWRLHEGVDYSAPKGTPIYATGDGKVVTVKSNFGGYGKEVVIDHGFGFTTRYAHMQSFNVKRGQKVKRGECIGFVGNTGRSTAPHLHYEVRKNDKPVNPIHYIFKDITAEEYEELLKLASVKNQSLS